MKNVDRVTCSGADESHIDDESRFLQDDHCLKSKVALRANKSTPKCEQLNDDQ